MQQLLLRKVITLRADKTHLTLKNNTTSCYSKYYFKNVYVYYMHVFSLWLAFVIVGLGPTGNSQHQTFCNTILKTKQILRNIKSSKNNINLILSFIIGEHPVNLNRVES